MRPRAEGFALLAVLVLLAVVGLYTAATMQDTLFGTQLAGTRVFQQRAFMLADLGIQDTLQDLGSATPPADFTRELQPLADSADSVTVVPAQQRHGRTAHGLQRRTLRRAMFHHRKHRPCSAQNQLDAGAGRGARRAGSSTGVSMKSWRALLCCCCMRVPAAQPNLRTACRRRRCC